MTNLPDYETAFAMNEDGMVNPHYKPEPTFDDSMDELKSNVKQLSDELTKSMNIIEMAETLSKMMRDSGLDLRLEYRTHLKDGSVIVDADR